MNAKQFRKYLDRDVNGCYHCGDVETAVPQHRANRGLGGSKKRDHPANIIVLCSLVNGLIESNVGWQTMAREYGWKLSQWDDPYFVPVYDATSGQWWLLDDEFGRTRLSNITRAEDRPF
jgi:hypothetical protein